MSIKRLIVFLGLLLSVINFGTAACLISFTASLKSVTDEIVKRSEGAVAAGKLQFYLARYAWDDRLYDMVRSPLLRTTRERDQNSVYSWLGRYKAGVYNNEEQILLANAEKSINEYFRMRQTLVGKRLSPFAKLMTLESALDRAYANVEVLAEQSSRRTRELNATAGKKLNNAKFVAILTLIIPLIFLLVSWRLVYQWIAVPMNKLMNSMTNFSEEKFKGPVPEKGPTELAMISSVFNQLSDKLVNQREMRLKFLSSVAHDLRNPLGAIRLSMGILSTRQISQEKFSSTIALVTRQIIRLDQMVGDLLDFTRIEAGHLELQLNYCSLNSIIDDAVQLYRSVSNVHNIQCTLPDQVVICQCDSLRIGQCLNNLLDNAIKYSPKGGKIQVEMETAANGVAKIRISDEGIGIRGNELGQIFEPFQRSTTAHQNFIGGVGLGLSITKRIIEAHGGSIAVNSTISQGSEFIIEIPTWIKKAAFVSGRKGIRISLTEDTKKIS